MDIVVATDSFPPIIDGVADTAETIACLLSRRGHHVRVVAPGPGFRQGDGYDVTRIPSLPFPLYPQFRIAAPPATLSRLLRRTPPDAAIVLTPGLIGLSVARALAPRTRLVNVYSTDMLRYARAYGIGFLARSVEWPLRWLSRRADVTLCPTEHVRSELAARGHPRLHVWGGGVNAALFHPGRVSAEMRRWLTGGEPEKPLILYVGRLAREKRLLDLLDAARQLRGVRVALVGDGPQRDLLERRFAAVPTIFTGFLRGESLARAFASADVFAFPSESETFGQVVLQAMASGLPPVVVQGTAPAEFVPDGVCGIHVRPRSPSALAAAIASLVEAADVRRSLAAAAREQSLHFSWSTLVDRLEEILAPRPDRVLQPAVVG